MSCNCQKAHELIQDHLDGMEIEEDSLSSHLQQCPKCKCYREDQEQLRETLTSWRCPSPSASFTQSALQAILENRGQSEPTIRRPFLLSPRTLWPFAVAAGVLFAVGFGLFSKLPVQEQNQAEQMAVARAIGHHQMVDRNRDLRLMGLAYPARSFFPNTRSRR